MATTPRFGAGLAYAGGPGQEAGGLKVDQPHQRLFVAGALTGHGYVYDTRSGAPLADFAFGPAGTVFINDVIVTKGGAYFTDSVNPVLYKIPIAADGSWARRRPWRCPGRPAPSSGSSTSTGSRPLRTATHSSSRTPRWVPSSR